ncbi:MULTISPECIES: hypothetical protein [Rhodomicrobium]|uniref:hypothetical protein n=1 Tax=Rhodomicrobium TaxID=1068 RepID=UPI000F7379F3|nr:MULTISPECIES: hypothetical protein [Rhodomicrobium]
MEHEYPSDWKQLGNLANGILRSVAEKRMKQAEFMATESLNFDAALHSPRAENRIQPELPLFREIAPLAEVRAGRF